MTAPVWVSLFVGFAAFAGVMAGLAQRTMADKRAEWWRRATWAVDHSLSDSPAAQVVGFDILGKLQESSLVTRADRHLFAAWASTRIFDGDDTDQDPAHTGTDEEER